MGVYVQIFYLEIYERRKLLGANIVDQEVLNAGGRIK